MGTTCSTLVLGAHGALIGHVGDSRVYRVRKRVIEQLTFDHSLQWETRGPDSEQIMPRNVITRCLGPEPEVQPDIEGPFRVRSGDRFVLCSDGLTSHVEDAEIGAIVRNMSCTDAAQMLVNLANLRGGSDNCTVITANLGQIDSTAADSDPGIQQISGSGMGSAFTNAGFAVALLLLLASVGLMFVPEARVPRLHPDVSNVVLGILASSAIFVISLLLRQFTGVRPSDDLIENQTAPRQKTSTIFQQARPEPPYRRESSLLTVEFLDTLQQQLDEATSSPIVSELSVDWDAFNETRSEALSAKNSENLREALAATAKGLQILMESVAARRREIDVANRWGAAPAENSTEPAP